MAAGDRETTLILKAADLSSQTIEKVLATAAKLLTFQETLNAKVASGTVRISEFNGSLNNILQVFTALAQMKLVFPETERLERTVAAQQARVEALKARAAEIQAIPEDERTRKQQGQLDRFTSVDLTPAGNPKGTIAAAEQRLDLTTARLQRNLDLERAMGVTEENRAALQAQINSGLERHTQELLRARNAQLEIIEANLRERDAQAELKRITEEVAAINRRAAVDTKTQEAALRELTSEAKAFDAAIVKAFDDAAKAADRLKGEQFTRDYGDASFEKAKREKKAADDIALAQQDAAHDEQQRKKREQQAEALEASRRRAQLAQTQLPQIQEVAPAQQFDALTRGLQEIVSPAEAARQTINGLLLETVKLAEATRQSGQSAAQYREMLRSVEAAYKDVRGQAGLIDTYKQQIAAREIAGEAMHRERAALDELVAKYDGATKADAELDRAIKSQEGVATRAVNNFNRLGSAISETQGQLRAAGIDFNDLAGSEKKLEITSGLLAASLGTVKESILKTQQATASGSKDELTKYLEDSRRKAADFRASLPPVQAFGEAVPGAGGFSKTTETVAAIDAIRDPAAAARQTFEGLRAEVNKVNAEFEASPKRIQDASKATNDLAAAFNDLRRQAGVFDLFRQSEAETVRTTRAMQDAVQKLNALERQQASSTTVDENLTRAIKAQRAEVASSISAYSAANAAFARYKEAAQAAGLQTGDTNAQLKAFSETATLVSERLDALDKITGKSTKSQPILFGLRGYELQNLGYQINDVVSGFASGQQTMQIIAQQSGQIFQIWERDIGTMLYGLRQMPLALVGIGVAAATAVFSVIALVNQMDRLAAQRQIAGNLALNLDPGSNNAKALADAASAAAHLGAAYADAVKGAIELSQHGFTDDDVKRILTIAQNLAVARGKPFADSLKALQDVLHGSADDVRKFSQEWVGLNDTARKAIEGLINGGHTQEAQVRLLEEIATRAEEAAKKVRSRVSEEMIHLRQDTESQLTGLAEAWDKFWAKIIQGADRGAKSLNEFSSGPFWKLPLSFLLGGGFIGAFTHPVGGEGKPDAGGPTTVPAAQDKGLQERQANLMQSLMRDLQLSREQAAGLVGNLSHESGIQAVQEGKPVVPGSRGGFGWAQWTAERREQFEDFAKQNNLALTSDEANYKFLLQELRGSKAAVLADIRKQTTVEGATRAALPFESGAPLGQEDPRFKANLPSRQRFAQQAFEAGAAGASPARPNAQAAADEEFAKKEAERRYTQILQTGSPEEKDAALAARIDKINEDARNRASVIAKQPGSAEPDTAKVEASAKQEREDALREYLKTLADQDVEVQRFRREISQRELNADKTNLQNRQKANDVEYDALQRQADAFKAIPGRLQQAGVTAQELDASISKARVDADNRTKAEVAAAIWDKFNSEQKAALDVYGNNVRHGLDVAGNVEKARQEVASRAGAREEARQKAIDTLQGVPDTAETRALRGRIESQAAIAARPPDLKQFLQEAAQQTAQPVEEQFKALEEMMKGLGLSVQRGARPFSDALQEATTKLQQRLPELTRATNEAVTGLQRLIDGGATPAQIEEYKLKQQQLQTRLQQAPKDILLFVNAGLEDQQKELESLVKRYKDLIAKAVQLQVRGLTGAAQEALNEAEKVRAQIGPARDNLVGNARQAAQTPGLPAGEVASLEERADKASKEGDPQQLRVQGILDQAKGAEEQIKQFQSSLREHQATEQQLLAKGLTTQTAYEAEMKRAYEETSAQAQPAIQHLLDLADAAEKAGASASKVAQLRDQAKLLRAELAYVPPLTQQIMLGFEQAFVSRGEQAFDSIAKAIGTAAVEGGKLKDVWRAIGNGFANMAAGILQDVAKIIIKYELLKVIKDALGVDTGAGGGSKSGGGGTGVGGLFGALISALGLGGAASGATTAIAGTAAGQAAAASAGASAGELSFLSMFAHTGRIVGDPTGVSRPVDLTVFHEAQRMHSGGLVGLAHDEVPAILQRNEEVLSKSDPRNRLNMSAQQPAEGSGTSIRNVLAVGDREIASAMNTPHGEKVILNVLQRNAPTVKKYVG